MRDDLKAAYRALGLMQRFLLREYLGQLEPLLEPAETVQVLTPGWWRAQRCLVVVTTSRLLLLRRRLKCSLANQVIFSLQRITYVSVHPTPPDGARFRLAVGLDVEEFSVAQGVEELRRSLRPTMA